MKNQETSLSEIGLYGLIQHINKKISSQSTDKISSYGEDAFLYKSNEEQFFSQTLMLEGIHFDMIYTPLQHLGFKLIVNAITDILAMNSLPEKISIAVGLSKKMTLEKTDLLLDGVLNACKKYDIELISFKPFPSLTGLSLSASVIGDANKNSIANRNGAKPTDVLLSSGDLGASLLGLHLLEREKRVLQDVETAKPELDGNEYVLQRQLKPEAKIDVINQLSKLNIVPTSMISIKEGLANAIILLTKSSEVGCRIYENKIPLHQETLRVAKEMDFNPLIAALNGGEDFELLFTISLNDFQANETFISTFATAIGYITEKEKSNRIISLSGDEIDIKAQGWGEK